MVRTKTYVCIISFMAAALLAMFTVKRYGTLTEGSDSHHLSSGASGEAFVTIKSRFTIGNEPAFTLNDGKQDYYVYPVMDVCNTGGTYVTVICPADLHSAFLSRVEEFERNIPCMTEKQIRKSHGISFKGHTGEITDLFSQEYQASQFSRYMNSYHDQQDIYPEAFIVTEKIYGTYDPCAPFLLIEDEGVINEGGKTVLILSAFLCIAAYILFIISGVRLLREG